jgi:aquaporin related protein
MSNIVLFSFCLLLTISTGIYYTGGSLNFARSLGPAAVNHDFPGYFWIYFVGPLLGSLLASAFYALINSLRYQTCNPGQDFGEEEAAARKVGSQSDENGPPNARHQRNMSEATAVNHDRVGNTGLGQKDAISPSSPMGQMHPVAEKHEQL